MPTEWYYNKDNPIFQKIAKEKNLDLIAVSFYKEKKIIFGAKASMPAKSKNFLE